MIELKISKGEYLTHKDLEKFLNSYKKFLNDYLNKENLFEYEWEEFWIFHNNYIKQQITKYNKIELIVEDISKGDFSGSYELLESICFTGEDLGNWRDKNDRILWVEDVFRINFKQINIKGFSSDIYNRYDYLRYLFPDVSFLKLTTENPGKIKKGDTMIFNLNILREKKGHHFTESRDLVFFEKVNVLPPENESNSNCFVVTATMGDINHPVVNDFRNYRDEVLLNTISGRLFIKLYYQIGPYLSEIIKNNKTLFQISRSFILKLHKRISK